MSAVLEIAIKTSALFLLAFAVLRLLRSRSAAIRHGVLALAFMCAVAVPLLRFVAPAWRVPLPTAWLSFDASTPITISSDPGYSSPAAAAIVMSASAGSASSRPDALRMIVGIWLVGVLAAMTAMIGGLARMRQIGRRASPMRSGAWRDIADRVAQAYGLQQPIDLLQSAHPTMLVTWGIVRPRILLPASALEWSADRIEVVLRHEIAHITRGDWPTLIAASVVRAIHWFNPIVWIGHRRLRQESEQACDDLVLESGIAPADYATHLLAVARETIGRRHVWSAATAIAQPSTLEGRVRAMLNARLNRRPMTAIARWTSVLVALTAALAIAGAGVPRVAASVVALPPSPASQASVPSAPSVDRLDINNATPVHDGVRINGVRITEDVLRKELASSAAPAQQAGPGAISGVLYDQLGGLLPGAMVALVQQPDLRRYDTITDRNGAFLFTLLPPGDYALSTSLPGFSTVTNLVRVGAGATVERSITMPIGTLQELISVTGPGDGVPRTVGGQPAPRPRPAPEARTFFSGGIGGQIRVPNKVLHVNPVYPSALQNASGIVLLEARIGIDGFLSDIHDVTGSRPSVTHEAFLASALDAVRQWEFTPVLLNNVPVEANIKIKVDYSIR